MTPSPIWFGPQDRPLFGWIHLPERAVGGVVLCQPIGYESHPGYRACFALAEALEAAGFVVMRFDYSGTGDSAGDVSDVHHADVWLEDVQRAVDIVRDTGVSKVGLVGIRAGALLAGEAALARPVDALVLWDPSESGRSFLREQRMLGSAVGLIDDPWGPPLTGFTDIIGFRLPDGLAQSLSPLDLAKDHGEYPERLFVLARPDRPVSSKLRRRLEAAGAEWDDSPVQQNFIEPLTFYRPEATAGRVAEWCVEALASSPDEAVVPMEPPYETWRPLTIEGSSTVVDRPTVIAERNLFAMLTEAVDVDARTAPAMLLLNAAHDRHIGPSRLWVHLARAWSDRGVRVLRVDLDGLGDSATRPGFPRDVSYPAGGVADVLAAARFLSPDDPSKVAIVGVCSGAYFAAEAAVALKSTAIWAFNPFIPLPSDVSGIEPDDSATGPSVVRQATSLTARYMYNERAIRLVKRFIPNFVFWICDKAGLYTYPLRAYEALIEQGTDTYIVCGRAEAVQFLRRGKQLMRRMERTGRLHFSVAQNLDHGIWMPQGRAEMVDRLTTYVDCRLPLTTTTARSTDAPPMVAREDERSVFPSLQPMASPVVTPLRALQAVETDRVGDSVRTTRRRHRSIS